LPPVWIVIGLVAACGGTTGAEGIVGPDDASPGGDATVEASVATDDGTIYDRAVPARPPAQTTGVAQGADATSSLDASAPTGDGGVPEAGPSSTLAILAAQSADCVHFEATDGGDGGLTPRGCIIDNSCLDPASQGASCETLAGEDAGWGHFNEALPDGKMCNDPTLGAGAGVSETAICLRTLARIFSSRCAQAQSATTQNGETACLCGTVDPTACTVTGTETPNGPVYDEYACDFNNTNGSAINTLITSTSFGAGVANQIIQCAAAFATDPGCGCCLGIPPPDGGTCAPGIESP
jgi:hypothetical protein